MSFDPPTHISPNSGGFTLRRELPPPELSSRADDNPWFERFTDAREDLRDLHLRLMATDIYMSRIALLAFITQLLLSVFWVSDLPADHDRLSYWVGGVFALQLVAAVSFAVAAFAAAIRGRPTFFIFISVFFMVMVFFDFLALRQFYDENVTKIRELELIIEEMEG